MDNRPIGIYDSGMGGLSVWQAIRTRLPQESLLYLGDGENCPYGLLSVERIQELAQRAVEKLLAQGVKMVVVACNTATIAAVKELRERYPDVPIVGLEPAVKPACLNTKTGVVGVLATQRSIEGDMFQRTASKYGENIEVVARFGRGFVELVESDMEGTKQAEQVVKAVVEELVEKGVDQIVLGCTHYPFLSEVISRIAPQATVIDPSPAVARQVERRLTETDMLSDKGDSAEYDFVSFAGAEYVDKLRKKSEKIWLKK